MCGLDAFFVGHLYCDAVISLLLVSAMALDGKEMPCASSVNDCCGLIWGWDSWFTVSDTVTARTNILPLPSHHLCFVMNVTVHYVLLVGITFVPFTRE
jgi:hypothetical protein